LLGEVGMGWRFFLSEWCSSAVGRSKDAARKNRRVNDRLAIEEGFAALDCGASPPGARVEAFWRTPTVLSIARRIRADRDVAALPVLADALEEAGCVDQTILNHLRDDRSHRSRCWVVELVMRGRDRAP